MITRGRVIFVVIAVAVFVLDRVTKTIVAAQVPYGGEVAVVDHVLGIANVHNSGAAFGTAPAFAPFFLLASALVAIGLAVYVFRTAASDFMYALLGLIMGGTVGNGYERLVNGTVTDFINFHFWPVFNVADSAVSVGVVLLIAAYAFRRPGN
ncbi:MAG TPA: signal peptidase II [Candidatus Dormibacteraeota bacterium]|nr:signal peptidase II [Candidatus Dormibacteraeota bacterium]